MFTMRLLLEAVIAAILCGAVILIVHIAKSALMTPVPTAENSQLFTVIAVKGGAEHLEQTVRGLIWLDKNGTLKNRVVIVDCGLEEQSRRLAELFSQESGHIAVCRPEEIPIILEENGWKRGTYK